MLHTDTKLRFADLLTDPATGRFSHTRLWSNIGCAAATLLFVKHGWNAPLSSEIWLIYLGSVGGFAALSKFQSLKHSGPNEQPYQPMPRYPLGSRGPRPMPKDEE